MLFLFSSRLVFYKHILKNEKAAKELESLFDEIDSIEVNHVFSTDYFRKGGPKDKASYVAPKDFVRDLKEKVDAQLEATSKRYSQQYWGWRTKKSKEHSVQPKEEEKEKKE